VPLLLLPRLWLPRLWVFRKGLGPRTSSSAHNNALVTGVALRLLARVGVVVRWVVTVDAKGMGKLGIFGEVRVETRDERRSLVVGGVGGNEVVGKTPRRTGWGRRNGVWALRTRGSLQKHCRLWSVRGL
jgi:hypothetical protein